MSHPRARRPPDLTESSELRIRSFEADARLHTVTDIARALSARMTLDQLLELIMDKLTRALDGDRSTLFLVSDDGEELWSTVAQGARTHEIRVRRGQGIAGWVAATGRGVNVKDAYQDPRFDPQWDADNEYRTTSMLCQPVFDRDGGLVGVVQVLNKQNGYFTVDDEALLGTIMAMAAIAIVNAQLHNTLVFHNVALSETQQQLAEKVSEIDLLYSLERQAADAPDLDAALRILVERIAAAVPSSLVQVVLPTADGGMIAHRTTRGIPGIELLRFERATGLSARVLATGDAANVCNLPVEMGDLAQAERMPFTPHVGLCLPLAGRDPVSGRDGVLGALAVYDRPRHQCLTDDDHKLLTLVSGQVARAIGLRRAREQAEREDRLAMVGRALAGVMHDFRSPMTVASGYVQLLKAADEAEERAELADLVLQQLDRMMQMTREVLSFARGEQTMFVRKVLVAEFAREARQLVDQIFAASAIETEVRCHYTGQARFDIIKMLRVVQNMARNSRDALHARPGSRFTLDIAADGQDLVLTFSDNGAGVPQDFRHRLFDAFATQGKKDGTGLGLAMVKQFAEAHGGTVTYRDTPGGGATFEMRILRDARPNADSTVTPPVEIGATATPRPAPAAADGN